MNTHGNEYDSDSSVNSGFVVPQFAQQLRSLRILVNKHPEIFTYVNPNLASLSPDENLVSDEKFPDMSTILLGVSWTGHSQAKLLVTTFGLELHLWNRYCDPVTKLAIRTVLSSEAEEDLQYEASQGTAERRLVEGDDAEAFNQAFDEERDDLNEREDTTRLGGFHYIDDTSPYRFEICPRWIMSGPYFVWFKNNWYWHFTGEHQGDEDARIAPEKLEEMYPEIAAEFEAWALAFRTAFELNPADKSNSQLQTGAIFSTTEDRIAWQTRGMLISCWLARQPDVKEIGYLPDSQNVWLSHNNQEEAWRKLLIRHENVLLAAARGEPTDDIFQPCDIDDDE